MSNFKKLSAYADVPCEWVSAIYPYDEKAELKAENEKLRKERDHWHVEQVHAYGNWEDAHKRVIELESENAKLRELASAAHSCKTNDGCCEDCYCDEGCCPIERRMQELGIEVPE